MESDTIIGVQHEAHPPLRSMLQSDCGPDPSGADEFSRLFKIRSADSFGQRSGASVLINRMYAARGYRTTPLAPSQQPTRITFTATEHEETIGTITVGFESAGPLHVDELFAPETEQLRAQGRRLCEFTKLAMDSAVKSKRVLASLFHVAYIFAHRVVGIDDLVIEVNPRHVRYYQCMLGFETIGSPRHNSRVNAPAVLMRLRFSHAHEQIERFAGHPELGASERSLYPYFFSIAEEASIVGRLKRTQSAWGVLDERTPPLPTSRGSRPMRHLDMRYPQVA